MFSNVGKTIKVLAIVVTVIGLIISIVGGINLADSMDFGMFDSSIGEVSGLFVFIIGVILSATLGIFMYAFGELVDKTTEIANILKDETTAESETDKRREVLKDLLSKGLISQDEYNSKIQG